MPSSSRGPLPLAERAALFSQLAALEQAGVPVERAFAMVQLGLTLEGVGTALDLEEGLAYLDLKIKHHAKSSH